MSIGYCNLLNSVVTLTTILASLLIIFIHSDAYSIEINIFTSDSKPYGLEYEQHIQNYWKWQISLPVPQSPIRDETGERCTNGQTNSNSPIFFLSGGGGGKFERTCNVPSGKGVLIPVMTVEVSDKEVPNADVATLHEIAKKDQDSVTSLYLKINDVEYTFEELKKYRKHTDVFDVEFPEQAIFGATPGKSKAVADGYYIITEPLPKGEHVIHMKGSLECSGTGYLEQSFDKDIKYIITMV